MCDYLVFMTYVGRFSPKSTPPRWNVSCLLVYYRRSEHCAMHQQRQPCSWQVWRLWLHISTLTPCYTHASITLCCPRSLPRSLWFTNSGVDQMCSSGTYSLIPHPSVLYRMLHIIFDIYIRKYQSNRNPVYRVFRNPSSTNFLTKQVIAVFLMPYLNTFQSICSFVWQRVNSWPWLNRVGILQAINFLVFPDYCFYNWKC